MSIRKGFYIVAALMGGFFCASVLIGCKTTPTFEPLDKPASQGYAEGVEHGKRFAKADFEKCREALRAYRQGLAQCEARLDECLNEGGDK